MSTVGIIAEYNPFHKGHAYQINKAKELTGADNVIIVMSGNFMQRGGPAILDKYTRAKHAIDNGASLVLELPVCYSTVSAELFAYSAVNMLDKLGCVDYISFGCETDSITSLTKIAQILANEPEEYKLQLKLFLSQGISYPIARNKAISNIIGFDTSSKLMETPNNILAIEYLKSLIRLNSTIQPVPIKRTDNGYHSTDINSEFASATAIRKCLYEMNLINIKELVPENTLDSYNMQASFISADDFSLILASKLIYNDSFEKYYDISKFFSNRINNTKRNFTNFTSYADLLLTKNETYTHINRALIHILLGITKENVNYFTENGIIFYAKPLAMNLSSRELLKEIKNNSSIELVKRFGEFYKHQYGPAKLMLDLNIKADALYNHLTYVKTGKFIQDDFYIPNSSIYK